jgi:hypothetical protein
MDPYAAPAVEREGSLDAVVGVITPMPTPTANSHANSHVG